MRKICLFSPPKEAVDMSNEPLNFSCGTFTLDYHVYLFQYFKENVTALSITQRMTGNKTEITSNYKPTPALTWRFQQECWLVSNNIMIMYSSFRY